MMQDALTGSAPTADWPDSRLEAWKYTDLQGLVAGLSKNEIEPNTPLWNFQTDQQSDSLIRSVKSGEPTTGSDALSRIIHASATGGWHIRIPKGICPELPLRVSYAPLAPSGWSAYHHQIRVEEGARLTLIEEFGQELSLADRFPNEELQDASSGPVRAMALHHLEVHLEPGAELKMIRLFRSMTAQALVHQIDADQEEGSKLLVQTVALGSGIIRNNIHIQQRGNACSGNLLGLSWARNGGHIDQYSRIQHHALDGNSHQHYKAIAAPNSTAVFNGVLRVEPHAQQSNAYQRSSNLMLDPAAHPKDQSSKKPLRSGKVNAKPELQIFADNVKCSHGATMGKLNTDSIFYLQSRGLSGEQARRMLTIAFAMEIVDQVEDDTLRSKVISALDLFQ
jgi:Fe-S cluster assembly protein SufD